MLQQCEVIITKRNLLEFQLLSRNDDRGRNMSLQNRFLLICELPIEFLDEYSSDSVPINQITLKRQLTGSPDIHGSVVDR